MNTNKTNRKPIKVIMAGSGALYPAYLGTLLALHKTKEIKEVAGTSGGAIAACVWALSEVGQAEKSLLGLIEKTLPLNTGVVRYSLFNFLKRGGFVNGDKLEQVFKELFFEKLKQSRIPINIFVTNSTRCKNVQFSSREHGEQSVAKVLRASCSIPFIFDRTIIDGVEYVDGGWSQHFPTSYFSDNSESTIYAIRIVESNEPYVRKSIVEYIQGIMYGKLLQGFSCNSFPENVRMVELRSKFAMTNLANTTIEQAKSIFREGYEQTEEILCQEILKENTMKDLRGLQA